MPRYLITSALPYINGVKHLGNLIGSMLPADVLARHLRQQGEEVLYICGTDEHGTPAEIAAFAEGKSPKEYCDEQYAIQDDIYKQLRISFDYFGRSSSPTNHQVTQDIFRRLDENGFIEERTVSQIYSIDDQRFLPDRYVVGTCPICGFKDARGDQCDSCGSLIDPTQLIEPRSAISGSTNLEVRDSRHLFLRLSALQDRVRAWVDQHQGWPATTKGIAYKWLDEGLQDRSITRDLAWGIPVPKPGFEGKVFYVWFDAPIAYVSMTVDRAKTSGDPEAWRAWWKEPGEVRYLQFMGKDNVPFHAVMWPATMLGTGDVWVMADQIKSFSWLTYEGGKFSTSRGRGIFTDTALTLFPSDYWRYALLAMVPEGTDSDFSLEGFAGLVNKDMADVLGNFVNRVLTMVARNFEGRVPEPGRVEDLDRELIAKCRELVVQLDQELRATNMRKAMRNLRALWVAGNEYITLAQPWVAVKNDRERAAEILRIGLELCYLYAVTSAAIIPDSSERIFELLGETGKPGAVSFEGLADFARLPAGRAVSAGQPLFQKIAPETVAELTERFRGSSH
ncbi:MAG: methionine--tRNA ligase [Acidobacteriota bacterium]